MAGLDMGKISFGLMFDLRAQARSFVIIVDL